MLQRGIIRISLRCYHCCIFRSALVRWYFALFEELLDFGIGVIFGGQELLELGVDGDYG